MPRRNRKAEAVQLPGEHPATQLRGHGPKGAVRPADNRFLDEGEGEIAMRDAYLEEVNPDAQQLVIKAESPEHVEALSSVDAGTADADDEN